MKLDTLIVIILMLIAGIVFLKAIRKLLGIALSVLILYFAYYTFFTFPGAAKIAVFKNTFSFDSYKVDISKYSNEGVNKISPPIYVGKYSLSKLTCTKYNPIILCDSKVKELDN